MCSVDSIEANVETADVNVQRGTQQLARAADYQVKHNWTDKRMDKREDRQIHKEGIKRKEQQEGRGVQRINVIEVSS